MIQATRKTGFLIEDGAKLGKSIALLQDAAIRAYYPELREIANWLNDLQVNTYYQPVQTMLDLVEEVAI